MFETLSAYFNIEVEAPGQLAEGGEPIAQED
jgi:hypothetical protein